MLSPYFTYAFCSYFFIHLYTLYPFTFTLFYCTLAYCRRVYYILVQLYGWMIMFVYGAKIWLYEKDPCSIKNIGLSVFIKLCKKWCEMSCISVVWGFLCGQDPYCLCCFDVMGFIYLYREDGLWGVFVLFYIMVVIFFISNKVNVFGAKNGLKMAKIKTYPYTLI